MFECLFFNFCSFALLLLGSCGDGQAMLVLGLQLVERCGQHFDDGIVAKVVGVDD